jgi:quercetin dioxygenase-like cupin family protein
MRDPVTYGPKHPTEGYACVGERIHVLAHGEQTGAGEAFVQEGPADTGPPPHMHPWDEAFFMLEGEMEFTLGDRRLRLSPGMFVYVPAGTVHAFRYLTAGRFFSYTSAPGAAKFFAELDRGAPEFPPNIPRLLEIAQRHRISVPPPPTP